MKKLFYLVLFNLMLILSITVPSYAAHGGAYARGGAYIAPRGGAFVTRGGAYVAPRGGTYVARGGTYGPYRGGYYYPGRYPGYYPGRYPGYYPGHYPGYYPGHYPGYYPGFCWSIGLGWGPGWWGYPYPYYSYPPDVIQQQSPVYEMQTPQQDEEYYWYFCPDSKNYYPYVKQCPKGWLKVVPAPGPSQ